jgi:hypothetical protein
MSSQDSAIRVIEDWVEVEYNLPRLYVFGPSRQVFEHWAHLKGIPQSAMKDHLRFIGSNDHVRGLQLHEDIVIVLEGFGYGEKICSSALMAGVNLAKIPVTPL